MLSAHAEARERFWDDIGDCFRESGGSALEQKTYRRNDVKPCPGPLVDLDLTRQGKAASRCWVYPSAGDKYALACKRCISALEEETESLENYLRELEKADGLDFAREEFMG